MQTIEEKDKSIAKLEAEKYYLGERIFELTGVEESFWSDEILVIKKFNFLSYFLSPQISIIISGWILFMNFINLPNKRETIWARVCVD